MLLRLAVLELIVQGRQNVVYRRWHRPSVRSGGRLKTALGVLAIDSVTRVDEQELDEASSRAAGYTSRAALLDALADRDGDLYRVELHFHGADPRVALREDAELDAQTSMELERKLQRLDAASRSGAWTRAVLELIAARPATLAARLAAQLGRETQSFKRDVRKLKELGLTESLEVGYRLSPRGAALLRALSKSSKGA